MNDLVGRKNVAVWDERRNSSRVVPVPAHALDDARKALARWRAENPEHARWISDGYPTMTEAEHVARFGVPYQSSTRRSRKE